MKDLVFFDIETNGISDFATLSDLKEIHCACLIDSDGEHRYRADNINEFLERLQIADRICGHNIIGFDYPALQKLFGFQHDGLVDTLILSRLGYPDIRNDDFARRNIPKDLAGSHSLKAWGIRIGINKSEYGETSDWSEWSQEMEDYCMQDVVVTKNLYDYMVRQKVLTPKAARLEHDFAIAIRQQEMNGFPFDVTAAEALTAKLMTRRAELDDELRAVFKPTVVEMKSYWYLDSAGNKYPTKKAAVEVGIPAKTIVRGEHKTKEIPFNAGSRDQIAERLMEQGWRPAQYEGKRPVINEGVLKEIGTDESLLLLEYLLVQKRLGQVAEGKQAWLKLQRNGSIHGSVNTLGCVSFRCTHNNPNVAQVPSVRADYGEECRSCFTAPEGKVLVGSDASGLELRCLAHYLHEWDDGEYSSKILDGDIHTVNQQAAGLETRDQAKTYIYALCYGAGDAKIGQIINGTSADGRRLKERFMSTMPAFRHLTSAVSKKVKMSNMLRGIDGRRLICRSEHSALNLLLQSCGAIIMKQALVEFVQSATLPYQMHGNIHDEVQFSCAPEHADTLGSLFCDSIKEAGRTLGIRCPLDGEYKVGNNWKDTH